MCRALEARLAHVSELQQSFSGDGGRQERAVQMGQPDALGGSTATLAGLLTPDQVGAASRVRSDPAASASAASSKRAGSKSGGLRSRPHYSSEWRSLPGSAPIKNVSDAPLSDSDRQERCSWRLAACWVLSRIFAHRWWPVCKPAHAGPAASRCRHRVRSGKHRPVSITHRRSSCGRAGGPMR